MAFVLAIVADQRGAVCGRRDQGDAGVAASLFVLADDAEEVVAAFAPAACRLAAAAARDEGVDWDRDGGAVDHLL